jgi:predicted transcriptional regulator
MTTPNISDEILEQIHVFIGEYPGLHLTKLASRLNMRIIDVERCLGELERQKKITSILDNGYRRYYLQRSRQPPRKPKEPETWKRIYNLIADNPGLHLSKIAELLHMSKPLADYHLQRLVKEHKLIYKKETGYTRYYLYNEELAAEDKKILSLLRKDTPLKIVLYLANHTYARHKEILEHLEIAPSTLSYHLNNLIQQGIVEVHRYGDEKGYRLKNEQNIIEFVLKYRLHLILDGFNDLWENLQYKRW